MLLKNMLAKNNRQHIYSLHHFTGGNVNTVPDAPTARHPGRYLHSRLAVALLNSCGWGAQLRRFWMLWGAEYTIIQLILKIIQQVGIRHNHLLDIIHLPESHKALPLVLKTPQCHL